MATGHGLHPTQITAWKREAIEKLVHIFDEKDSASDQNRDAELTKLHATIGQLVDAIFIESLPSLSLDRRKTMIDAGHPRLSIAPVRTGAD